MAKIFANSLIIYDLIIYIEEYIRQLILITKILSFNLIFSLIVSKISLANNDFPDDYKPNI